MKRGASESAMTLRRLSVKQCEGQSWVSLWIYTSYLSASLRYINKTHVSKPFIDVTSAQTSEENSGKGLHLYQTENWFDQSHLFRRMQAVNGCFVNQCSKVFLNEPLSLQCTSDNSSLKRTADQLKANLGHIVP